MIDVDALIRVVRELCNVERNQYETCYVPEIMPFIEKLDEILKEGEE